jgi:hypothetical protein
LKSQYVAAESVHVLTQVSVAVVLVKTSFNW